MSSGNNGHTPRNRKPKRETRNQRKARLGPIPNLGAGKDEKEQQAEDDWLAKINEGLKAQQASYDGLAPIRMAQQLAVSEQIEALGGAVVATILCGKQDGKIVVVKHRMLMFKEIVDDYEKYNVARGTMVHAKYLYREVRWKPDDAPIGEAPAVVHTFQYEHSTENEALGRFQAHYLTGKIVLYDADGSTKISAPKADKRVESKPADEPDEETPGDKLEDKPTDEESGDGVPC